MRLKKQRSASAREAILLAVADLPDGLTVREYIDHIRHKGGILIKEYLDHAEDYLLKGRPTVAK